MFPAADIERFKQQVNTADTSSPRQLIQAYYEIYNSAYVTSGMLTPDVLEMRLDTLEYANGAPIGI